MQYKFFIAFVILMTAVISICLYYYKLQDVVISILICIVITYIIFISSFNDMYLNQLLSKHDIDYVFNDISGYTAAKIGETENMFSTTYGEITARGIQAIYDYVHATNKSISTFVDMGSGVGKTVTIARLCGFKKAIGIELVKDRHDQALIVYSRLPKEISNGIELYHGDMLRFDFSRFTLPIVVFASNILWSKKLNENFFRLLAKQCPRGSIIVSSTYIIPNDIKGILKKITTLSTPMSWDWQGFCYVFKKVA